jgi:SAM-dependent methyltransferase
LVDRLFPIQDLPTTGLTHEHVKWAYRLFLDREAENEGAILGKVAAWQTTAELRIHFLTSEEFQHNNPSVTVSLDLGGGVPVPPSELIHLVSGSTNAVWFLQGGYLAAQSIRDTLERNSLSLDNFAAVLDLGCGCGRVLRHMMDLKPGALHGTDYNHALIDWCQENLPDIHLSVNDLDPPLPYKDDQFDFIYALSVFTHLPESLQSGWIRELARVTKYGGYLLFTVHGESYRFDLSIEEQLRFHANRLVVKYSDHAGSNLCGAYHSPDYVRSEFIKGTNYRVVDHIPQGAKGNPHQDIYLLCKDQDVVDSIGSAS